MEIYARDKDLGLWLKVHDKGRPITKFIQVLEDSEVDDDCNIILSDNGCCNQAIECRLNTIKSLTGFYGSGSCQYGSLSDLIPRTLGLSMDVSFAEEPLAT